MPVQTTYPGVYVQEVPSGVRTITGVSTSVALFVGASKKGPINTPIRCFNYTSFKNTFGADASAGQLAQYVRLFFLNGGSDCWVVRTANAASASSVTLNKEVLPGSTLRLEAKDAGVSSDFIRANVSYRGAQPESTFTLELFRWEKDVMGNNIKTNTEVWPDLSFDPSSSKYVQTFVTQHSKLVNATDLNPAPAVGSALGSSVSGRAVPDAAGASGFRDAWRPLLGNLANTNTFKIKVAGRPYVDVDLSSFSVTNTQANLTQFIADSIELAYQIIHGISGVKVTVSLIGSATGRRLEIKSDVNGDVSILPGNSQPFPSTAIDLTVPLMLGTAQGGIEVSGFADRRPAPNGITLKAANILGNIVALGNLQQDRLTDIVLEAIKQSDKTLVPQNVITPVVTTVAADLFTTDNLPFSKNANSDGIREKLRIIAKAINDYAAPAGHSWPWRAEVWGYRLAILPKETLEDNFLSAAASFTVLAPGTLPGNILTSNVHYYSLGTSGLGTFQTSGVAGSDGTAPLAIDYDHVWNDIVDREVDLFNLMILPPVETPAVQVEQLYADASVFCQKRRAFLLMDPPITWTDAQSASTGIATVRAGLVKDYSAIFFPQVTVNENGLHKNIGPAGALAGLFARIDSTRGVWKAPAGTEADLRGIVGVSRQFSDAENGILNPRAINTIRVFPGGIVNWGARTNQGDDDTPHDYKYIPVRRTALFIEESLYRGLKWVVFEPNDEPLWAQIRLNVGAFMHNLFRQGAFQGIKKSDAYFVKCDSETTTQNDINLGIVNVWVGFAPLKPAEFVILYLQQIAGNIQV